MARTTNSMLRRRWRKFKTNRRGYWSLIFFSILFTISLGSELISNDKPFLVYYEGSFYYPLLKSYSETTFVGDFETEADYRDPYILEKITTNGNKTFFPLNPHSYASINPNLDVPVPSPPTKEVDNKKKLIINMVNIFLISSTPLLFSMTKININLCT